MVIGGNGKLEGFQRNTGGVAPCQVAQIGGLGDT